MKNKYYYGLDGDVLFFEEQEVLDEMQKVLCKKL